MFNMASMNRVFRGKTVNEVWEEAYLELARQAASGHIQSSRDGGVVGEIINATLIVEDPTRMIVTSNLRNMPMRYAVGELMWYLAGSDKTRDIAQFSKVWNNLSDDGEHSNSAYGYRIFEKFGVNQWEAVKEMLTKDPLSRQAIIHIKSPEDNVTINSTKDLPCTLDLQFFIREDKLHMTVHMRSNDIWTGTPYDMFSFACFQVKMAMELGVEVGTYTHFAGSLHLYERNYNPEHKESEYDWMDEAAECHRKLNTKVETPKLSWSEYCKQRGLERVIAVDFDGTITETDTFPEIKSINETVVYALKNAKSKGAKIILWTCRSGENLVAAVKKCYELGITLDAVNENLPEVKAYFGYDTRKVWATEYWDDKNTLVK